MFWAGGLIGYFAGTLVTLLVIYFAYRIGEMNGEINKEDEDWLVESAEKEMDQYKALKNDKEERMSREEMIQFIIEGGKEFGEDYMLEELDKMSDEELKKQVEWVDYLLGK